MQKNDKAYAFLLTRKNKNRIFIKRVEVSRSLVHFGSFGIILSLVFTSAALALGTSAAIPVFAKVINEGPAAMQMALMSGSEPSEPVEAAIEVGELAINSGGPFDENAGDNESDIDARIREATEMLEEALLPTVWPANGKVNNEFGFRRNPFGGRFYEFHAGLDVDGERGDPVIAPGGGTVVKAGYNGGYGNVIDIDHGNGVVTRYGHLSKIEVAVGDTVTRGQQIGQVGSTGRSTGPHLHYEVRINDRPIDPRRFLPPETANIVN